MRYVGINRTDVEQLRRLLLNESYRFLAWLLPLILVANLVRLFISGPQKVAISTAGAAVGVVLIYRLRHRLSVGFKQSAILLMAVVVATESFYKFHEIGRVLVIMTVPVILFSCTAKPRAGYTVSAIATLYTLMLPLYFEVDRALIIQQLPLVGLSVVSFLLLVFIVSDRLFGFLQQYADNERAALRTDQDTGGFNETAIREQIELLFSRADAPVIRAYLLHLPEIVSGNNKFEGRDREKVAVYLNATLLRSLPKNAVHGRLGDGNMVVVAPRSDWSETETALRQLKATSVRIGEGAFSLDPVIVTTDGPGDGRTAEQLLDNLRRVLERALRDRLELARFLPFDRALQDTSHLFVGDIKQAMEAGDLRLFLQAKVNSTNEPAIIGAEALIRWHHPIKGLLSPGQFLPQIENSNARVEFAKYVIQQSAQLLNQISQHTEQFQLSFNLSPYDLNDLRVIAELQRVMELYDFDKGSLQIEISESETTVNVDGIRRSIDAIQNLGYSISLDDFGTGMCSLNYFSALAVDAVKIDRAFLESIETSEISRHVVQTIVDLCHGLGREVVVEGVETEKQAQLVTELGCDVLQGYYFGKPEEVKQFLGRLGENVTSIQ